MYVVRYRRSFSASGVFVVSGDQIRRFNNKKGVLIADYHTSQDDVSHAF